MVTWVFNITGERKCREEKEKVEPIIAKICMSKVSELDSKGVVRGTIWSITCIAPVIRVLGCGRLGLVKPTITALVKVGAAHSVSAD